MVRRLEHSDKWEMPYSAIESIVISAGARAGLTLMLDGSPLCRVTTTVRYEDLVGRLRAIGLELTPTEA